MAIRLTPKIDQSRRLNKYNVEIYVSIRIDKKFNSFENVGYRTENTNNQNRSHRKDRP